MPYTPPSPRSPASSTSDSPILSRSHSYANTADLAASARNGSARPSLPRSVSSTTYLQKHRRSPSLPDHKTQSEPQTTRDSAVNATRGRPISDILNELLTGDGDNVADAPSSDDETGRKLLVDSEKIKELTVALTANMHLYRGARGHSPTRQDRDSSAPVAGSGPAPRQPSAALSDEVRKIAHSRSSSEVQLPTHHTSEMRLASSDDSDLDDDEVRMKPPLLRKKSGELVKPALRPSSRRPSSMPGTPFYSKAVHFNENMEQVRHFLQIDKPSAVSVGSSPVESSYDSESEYPFGDGYTRQKGTIVEWEIKTSNFPAESFERKLLPVRVERIFLSPDNKSLVGSVAVANIAFQKFVVARFTLDYWKTTSEVVAEFSNDVRKQHTDGFDRFNFSIKLADQANLESKTLLLCARYNTNGQEFWDNNSNMNYQVDFIRKTRPVNKGGMQAGALGSIPRSRHASPTNGRNASTQPASPDDDFLRKFDSSFQFGIAKITLEPPNTAIRLKNHSRQQSRKRGLFPESARTTTSTPSGGQSQAFSTRYDFSASLSAALTTAQNALGEKSGIKAKPPPPAVQIDLFGNNAPTTTTLTAATAEAKPAALASDGKPFALQSQEYNDLIQKYCFFGSAANTNTDSQAEPQGKMPSAPDAETTETTESTETTEEPANPDVAADHVLQSVKSDAMSSDESSASSSAHSSGSNSPNHPLEAIAPLFDGANDSRNRSRSPSYGSRSQSPVGFSITARARSPVSFQSPWTPKGSMSGGLFGEGNGIVASQG